MKVPAPRGGAAQERRNERLYEALEFAAQQAEGLLWDPRRGVKARGYLEGRGISEETAKAFRLGYADPSGAFLVRKAKGLNGAQGVMIPKANVKNLMLKRDVIDAVEKDRFHIYQVSTIEEGIEILTGQPAGEPDAAGDYPEASVFGKVQKKLEQYLKQSLGLKKAYGSEEE